MSRIDKRIDEIEKKYLKKKLPVFQIGDVVDVKIRLKEGEKERTQIFSGTVIARKGNGVRENFTVRRIVAGEGVERVFPIHARSLISLKVRRPGSTRRAKLYYLRERVGKAVKTKERREEMLEASSTEKKAVESNKTKEPVATE